MSTQSELARLAETTIPPSGRDTRAILYLKSQNANALNGTEFRWRHYQPWLEEKGYLLRPRYHPQWQPVAQRTYVEREDSLEATVRVYNGIDRPPELNMRQSTRVLDATRVSDGSQVLLKVIQDDPEHLLEHDILKFLCSPHLKTDPRNHTVDLLDVFKLPNSGQTVLVMPLLREFHDPRFDTVGEAIEFFRQIFEAIEFMHEHGIAHGDCTYNNIMYDATDMYPLGFHPIDTHRSRAWDKKAKHFTRTERPVRYIVIDFGLSVKFGDGDTRLVGPARGGDKSAPEHRPYLMASAEPHDPFPTDVYYLGSLIRAVFIKGYTGFDFMKELVADMMKEVPSERPSMAEVVRRFEDIRVSLHWWTLRRRIDERKFPKVLRLVRMVPTMFRTLRYITFRIPAVPDQFRK